MLRRLVSRLLPTWQNALLAVLGAVLLILAFPDFDYWFLAWFALVPLMWAVEREKDSTLRSFVTGWLFGTVFFFGTCWWLTFAPINYAGFPWWLAYFLLLCVCLVVGLFPAMYAGILSVLMRRFGAWAFLAAPFVWVFTEFLRYWLTGNNWNAIGYSQAFGWLSKLRDVASVGGVYLSAFEIATFSATITLSLIIGKEFRRGKSDGAEPVFYASERLSLYAVIIYWQPIIGLVLFFLDKGIAKVYRRPNHADLATRFFTSLVPIVPLSFAGFIYFNSTPQYDPSNGISSKFDGSYAVAVQPNVPMSGLDYSSYDNLRLRQTQQAEQAFKQNVDKLVNEKLWAEEKHSDQYRADAEFLKNYEKKRFAERPKLVILPESPMNFAYNDDREFQQFIGDFARRNNVSVLFNSAEPDVGTTKYFNSAVMVGPDGKEAAQYDKIYLVPFGEAVPWPLEGILPGFVGNFAYGREYDILPVGDAKAGVMICFESHFGALSREYVRNGADVLIEMTNDGYLGPTPVLRQHLANAVFRAVETNRPVLRVTNVGITAYINERGQVLDEAPSYQEATRVWSVSKSDGSQTFYVKYGDWFAWLCSIVTLGLLAAGVWGRRKPEH